MLCSYVPTAQDQLCSMYAPADFAIVLGSFEAIARNHCGSFCLGGMGIFHCIFRVACKAPVMCQLESPSYPFLSNPRQHSLLSFLRRFNLFLPETSRLISVPKGPSCMLSHSAVSAVSAHAVCHHCLYRRQSPTRCPLGCCLGPPPCCF